jgi:hypothetical protein
MLGDLVRASRTSDPKAPYLHDHAAGDALDLLVFGLKGDRKKGVVGKGRMRPDIDVLKASRDRVVLKDCNDGTDWVTYRRDGSPVNGDPGGHHLIDATVKRGTADRAWKVSSFYVGAVGSC